MNELKDKALRKALKREENMPHLSPNFCFRTLQRIDELARLREKQAERRQLAAITTAAVLLAGSGVFVLFRLFGDRLRQAFRQLWETGRNADYGPMLFLAALVLILLGLDYMMRRTYYSRQNKRKSS
ncbi:MAG TPA: hypothetical protein H9950_05080 [Candidatus Bacteroides avicola]|mgnify:CR=1 FL=1|jgi:hypothetical protein|uniref:Uncharacterized protein n=1 Tax=Candidatus Bacteroides avicola TaxID=2838468 RepID=A0A9D2HUJ8_9BACE|nr:hypothetical protein [Bacteroidales bacterium SW292]HJA85554.1 hypothetical protein [Candidatus Bacteroides avicola]